MTSGEVVGYAHYPGGVCRPVVHPNHKLRGFKVNGVRPHTVVLFTDDPDYHEGARRTVCPVKGQVYKAELVCK